jgi:hypothetical protein
MGEEYRESSSHVVAWDYTALAMQAKNVLGGPHVRFPPVFSESKKTKG